jgi:UDP-N-acetylmuramyl pentapeptide phosphotransferase/UDP-N-acetylglucosamine-1-phosphate transferase
MDEPNERSLHDRPIPRGGGIAILISAALVVGVGSLLYRPSAALVWPAAGVLLVAVISFIDDRWDVAPAWRLLAQFAATGAIWWAGYRWDGFELPGLAFSWPAAAGAAMTALFVVWMINLYNFMDGLDGLAGGMAVIGFGTLGVLGCARGYPDFGLFCLTLGGAGAGFLCLNFPPARIFMGDVGSAPLGFLAAVCALWARREGILPLFAAILIFTPFIVDATVTLLWRALQGEKFWMAHREHFYQRLVLAGWGRKRTLWTEYALMLACALSAGIYTFGSVSVRWGVLAAWVMIYSLLGILAWRVMRREGTKPASTLDALSLASQRTRT